LIPICLRPARSTLFPYTTLFRSLPDLTVLSPGLIVGAAAVTIIVLVQGAGVSQSVPNPDGSHADPNRDFRAQGIGNIAAALFRRSEEHTAELQSRENRVCRLLLE